MIRKRTSNQPGIDPPNLVLTHPPDEMLMWASWAIRGTVINGASLRIR